MIRIKCKAILFAEELWRIDSRKKKALNYGADFAVNPEVENLSEVVKDITGGHGPAIAIDAVGLPETFKSCIDQVTPEGQVVAYGVGAIKPLSNLFIDDIVMKMLTIHSDQSSHRYYDPAIKLIETGMIDTESMISHRFPFEEISKAVDVVLNQAVGVVKAVIKFD